MMAKIAVLVLIISFLLSAAPAHAERRGFRATMVRRAGTAGINFTRAARQSHQRLSMLASRRLGRLNDQTPLWMDVEGSAYDMELSIGTPPQKLRAQADTGSDLIWTKCGRCKSCEPKVSPSFDPTKSSSFSKLPCSDRLCGALESESDAACGAGGSECSYKYTYDDGDYTKGYLANETFTLGGGGAMPGVGFGCSNVSVGSYGTSSGLVGLGRGALSLVSQLDAGAFSYCLTSNASKASPLLFGSLANLTGEYNSTRLLPSMYDYIVNLQNISIGSSTTPGVDSVMFDSGTTVTYLAEPAYTKAKKAVLSQTKLTRAKGRDEFHVCYKKPGNGSLAEAVPSMVLHFEGADMTLPVPNYFMDVGGGVVCWVVERSIDLSIIGNIMQMDFHVLHDVDNSMLSFQPANCDSL
ncbi:unnamed protein product [Urochloa humidicola]